MLACKHAARKGIQVKGTQRLIHGLIVVALGIAALLATTVGALSLAIAEFVPGETAFPRGWAGVPIALVPTIIAACSFAIAKRSSWRWLGLAALPIFAALAFLARDHIAPPELPDLGPRVGTEDLGYQAVMWFAEESPHSRLREPGAPSPAADQLRLPKEQSDWARYIADNRTNLTRAVETNTLGKEWIASLAQRPPAGVCPLAALDVLLAYRSVRNTTEPLLALAYTRALDGERDEAVRMVLPLLGAMHNLQRTSANLVHAMIVNVVLKRSYTVLDATLRLGPVGEDTRLQLAHALEAAPPIRQVFRNAFLGEADFVHLVLARIRQGDYSAPFASTSALTTGLTQALRFGGPLVFHPNRTERQLQNVYQQVCSIAESHDTEALENWTPNWGNESQLRNPVGRLLAAMTIPAFQKVGKEIWAVDDRRRSLLQKCEASTVSIPPRPVVLSRSSELRLAE